jgi:hypothetical protein
MGAINPVVVCVPDGRIGCLVHRMGLQGCVEFGSQRILETHHLTTLSYHFTIENTPATSRQRAKQMRKV